MKENINKNLLNMALALLDVEPKFDSKYPIAYHPFAESPYAIILGQEGLVDIRTKEGWSMYRNQMVKTLEEIDSVGMISNIIRKQYRMYYYSHINKYLNPIEKAEMLYFSYKSCENPSDDSNISMANMLRLFQECDFSPLNENRLDQIKENEVVVYRGVKNTTNHKSLSWTLSSFVAEWFANRFKKDDDSTYIISAKIKKDDIYLVVDDEDEVILNYNKLYDVKIKKQDDLK